MYIYREIKMGVGKPEEWKDGRKWLTIIISESYMYQNVTILISRIQKDDDEMGGKVIGHADIETAFYDTGILKWHEDF